MLVNHLQSCMNFVCGKATIKLYRKKMGLSVCFLKQEFALFSF